MKRILFTNAGLSRGREPEYEYYTQYAEVSLLAYNIPRKSNEIRYKGIRVFFPPIKPIFVIDPFKMIRGEYSITSFASFTSVMDIVCNSDIIITQDPNYFSYGLTKIAKQCHKEVVMVNFENVLTNSIFSSALYRKVTQYVLRNSSKFIPQTKRAAEFLTLRGVPDDKVKVIYPGINTELFHPSDAYGRNSDLIRFLFVGTLTETKGIRELLAAFEELERVMRNVRLTIIGSGALKDLVLTYQKKLGITYFEKVDAIQIASIYRQSDIFILLSRSRKFGPYIVAEEQLSFALLEAMASGLPVITTSCGSIPEVIGGDNEIINSTDISILRQKMALMAEDEKKRKEIGKQNRTRAVEMFDALKQSHKFMTYVLNEN